MAPRKRVLIYSAFYDPFISGAEVMVVETVRRLAGRFSICVVTARLDGTLPKHETKTLGGGATYEITRLGFGKKWDKYAFPLLAPLWSLKQPHDLVHAVMESYAGIALWWYRVFGGKKPTLLTLQSGDLDMPVKNKKIPRFVWRNIHVSPTKVVGISTALTNRAARLGAKDTTTIPNGVDFSHLANVPRLEKKKHRVVTVARLSPEKGLPFLIEAIKIARHSVADAELVIVGGGALEAELKKFTHAQSLQEVVRFLGAKPNTEAMTEVAQSTVFVLPSLGEGLGIVLLEAQALGVPVVGTNVGGIPDVIEHEKSGLLVPPSDPKALAEAIVRILSDAALAARLAETATSRLAKFDWDRIAEQYKELYEKMTA
ncbi:MAG: glycosyltransferase family 4 protein [Patescibacteria group bacterium]|nr:MAG: glycosyltransferase family 4 protein [Patescibacteria group bacterium]